MNCFKENDRFVDALKSAIEDAISGEFFIRTDDGKEFPLLEPVTIAADFIEFCPEPGRYVLIPLARIVSAESRRT